MSVKIGPAPDVDVVSSTVEHIEDARWWYERITDILHVEGLDPMTWVRMRSASKFEPWYRCRECGTEWAESGCLNVECPECLGWSQGIDYLGERPASPPEWKVTS